MTEKQLCEMCTEYSLETKCENEDRCKLLGILRENKKIKEKNRKLKEENERLRWEMSYPDLRIGDSHEMGAW